MTLVSRLKLFTVSAAGLVPMPFLKPTSSLLSYSVFLSQQWCISCFVSSLSISIGAIMTINVFGRDIWFCIRPNLGLFLSFLGPF